MKRLYELRTEKGLSQRGMAANFNVSQGTYNNWENGRTQPSVEQLVAMANFFGVSVDYLVSNDEVRNDIKDSLTEEQRKLFRAVSQLDVRSASLLADFLESLQK
ncbi:MAG TPA: transcriptional regulator [Clostridiales bacterium]|nr:transcriptional regulator [Clostridiales bacterium]